MPRRFLRSPRPNYLGLKKQQTIFSEIDTLFTAMVGRDARFLKRKQAEQNKTDEPVIVFLGTTWALSEAFTEYLSWVSELCKMLIISQNGELRRAERFPSHSLTQLMIRAGLWVCKGEVEAFATLQRGS